MRHRNNYKIFRVNFKEISSSHDIFKRLMKIFKVVRLFTKLKFYFLIVKSVSSNAKRCYLYQPNLYGQSIYLYFLLKIEC